MVTPPCCDKLNSKRALWTAEEDAKILAYVSKHGTGNWTTVPRKTGLKRCGKSCRLRWTNYLRPDLKHDVFTPQEEELIIRLHSAIGSRWAIIAQQLPGRTDNDVKNYWNTKLRKKLTEMGIDPVTHKPFSQILADYGNIGGFPKTAGPRIGPLTRDLKNAFRLKTERQSPAVPKNPHLATQKVIPPKFEPSGDHSLDLLTELQSITLVKEASTCTEQPSLFDQMKPSSSSSSSTCSTTAQAKLGAVGFSWEDFLLEDAFLPEQGNVGEFVPNAVGVHSNKEKSIVGEENENCGGVEYNNGVQVSSSSSSSFVEAILDQDIEMFTEFPCIFEDPFYY